MKNKKKKRLRILGKILFSLYIVFIIYFLIFSEWYGRTGTSSEYRYNLVLFKEIKRFWLYKEQLGYPAMLTNIVGNVLIFVPFGFFGSMAGRRRGLFRVTFQSFLLSLGVETFQLFTRVGSFDVDDLFLNTLGGCLGCLIYIICTSLRRRHDKR